MAHESWDDNRAFAQDLPRVLVVSNNCFSDTTNNGKTLASLFAHFPAGRVAQLYFSDETADHPGAEEYFKISDRDVLSGALRRAFHRRRREAERHHVGLPTRPLRLATRLRRFEGARLLRELLWATGVWETSALDHWLSQFDPEVVFFCAGDSRFAYAITEHVLAHTGAPLAVYITDDYVMPRRRLAPTWWLRRFLIKRKMALAVKKSAAFFTISPQMREAYKEVFGRDSQVVMNVTPCLLDSRYTRRVTDQFTLVYAGGLHYKRDRALRMVALAVRAAVQSERRVRAHFDIYSGQTLRVRTRRRLIVPGTSALRGSVSGAPLREVLNQADILVHAESFDRRSADATRLSISTKIPEYLSLGKPILAVGPPGIASMQYLRECAMCVTSPADLEAAIRTLLLNRDLRLQLGARSLSLYKANHSARRRRDLISRALADAADGYSTTDWP